MTLIKRIQTRFLLLHTFSFYITSYATTTDYFLLTWPSGSVRFPELRAIFFPRVCILHVIAELSHCGMIWQKCLNIPANNHMDSEDVGCESGVFAEDLNRIFHREF